MKVLSACALVAHGLHQDLDKIKKMPLPELFAWATIAAAITGRKFE